MGRLEAVDGHGRGFAILVENKSLFLSLQHSERAQIRLHQGAADSIDTQEHVGGREQCPVNPGMLVAMVQDGHGRR